MADGLVITVHVGGLPVLAEIPPETIEVLRKAIATAAPAVAASSFCTANEAAEILRCRKRRIYELVGDGRLTRLGDGRRLLVSRSEVERLASGEVTGR